MVLVEIPKYSHLFGERDVWAPVGGYGYIQLLEVVFRKNIPITHVPSMSGIMNPLLTQIVSCDRFV